VWRSEIPPLSWPFPRSPRLDSSCAPPWVSPDRCAFIFFAPFFILLLRWPNWRIIFFCSVLYFSLTNHHERNFGGRGKLGRAGTTPCWRWDGIPVSMGVCSPGWECFRGFSSCSLLSRCYCIWAVDISHGGSLQHETHVYRIGLVTAYELCIEDTFYPSCSSLCLLRTVLGYTFYCEGLLASHCMQKSVSHRG
jgi:hypothetical protein